MTSLKPSGATWLGDVPSHWQLSRLGSCFSERKETVSDTEYAPLSVTKNGVVPQLDNAAKSDNSEGRKLIRAGDFVINSRSDRKGSAGVATVDGSCSVIYTVLEPTAFLPEFAHHAFRSEPFQEEFYRWGSGIVADLWSTRYSAMKQITVAVPPADEQKSIASFLDRELDQIDNLIAKQEQLITTLVERKIAYISKVVSQGLNAHEGPDLRVPTVLGLSPSHWGVKRIKYSVRASKNGVWGEEPAGDETDIWCVRIADFDRESHRVDLSKRTTRSIPQKDRSGRLLKTGDLIIEKSGGGDQSPVGCVVSYDHDDLAVTSNFAARIELSSGQDPRFWVYAHAALYGQLITWRSIKQTSGIQNLDYDSYMNEQVGFPPYEEQRAIGAHLDEYTANVERLSECSLELIEHLKERRQALISAAVTGKIYVRG